jgi:DNA-binding transcriptional LysR family regulator
MPSHIETQELRVFHAVYETGGFGSAADKLFVTQSAISQTVANLEKKLGCQLFQRNPLQLTDAGIRMLGYAEVVLGEERELLTDIRNIQNGVLANLSLGMNATVNLLYSADLIQRYTDDSPLTRIKINVIPSRQIYTAVATDVIELGFGPFQQTMPDRFEAIPLFQDNRSLMIHSQHPEYVDSADAEHLLRRVPLIVSQLDDPDERPANDKLRDAFGTIWEISDMDLRIRLVSSGMGMSYLDQRLANNRPEMETLTTISDVAFATIPLTWGLFHRKKRILSTGARQFIELCKRFDFG